MVSSQRRAASSVVVVRVAPTDYVRDHEGALQEMVEDDEGPRQHESEIGQSEIVLGSIGQMLELAHAVVAEKTDGATMKGW